MFQGCRSIFAVTVAAGVLICGSIRAEASTQKSPKVLSTITGKGLSVSVDDQGAYTVTSSGSSPFALFRSVVGADIDSHSLYSNDYPEHHATQSTFSDDFGSGLLLTLTHTGLKDSPDLICLFRVYQEKAWGDIEVKVANTSARPVTVQAIRTIVVNNAPSVNLGGPVEADRILSDSYSEDRPQLAIRDLGTAPNGMHRGVGSQLIYNKQSGQSIFVGALTSDKLLTVYHLKEQKLNGRATISSYEVVAEGTTEIMRGESLHDSPRAEQVVLSLPLESGESLSSERLMLAVGNDYHAQLENYGRAVSVLHKARVKATTPIGWWSWTAYYFGLNEGAAITNIEWLSSHLKSLGYRYYQIDEGYSIGRGEYMTADANLFPHGLQYVASNAVQHGLTFGVWASPFQVSERTAAFRHHKDWLLHNSAGDLIHTGTVTEGKDPLYVLDVTNPGAQEYLRKTYTTLRNWGVRFIKLDFMDDSAVEGAYHRPNTTALEAERIGLSIIRQAVGEDVLLDKDGSPMLNPVGLVDAGRISQDTGHTFEEDKEAASGIAARYYMNRNFFIADPDAFTVSTQRTDDQSWNSSPKSLTLDEAKLSIALAAVSGGMFEIGDDLPTLNETPDRLALVENSDLMNMARMGRASTPIDLMTYESADEQPSQFLLKVSPRKSVLTVFNWTDKTVTRTIPVDRIGLERDHNYESTMILGDQSCCTLSSGSIHLAQAPHSVAMIKLIDGSIPATEPALALHVPESAKSGETVSFLVTQSLTILTCHWEFGDGVDADTCDARHTFTHPGDYDVKVTVSGVDDNSESKSIKVSVSGTIATHFMPHEKRRPE